MQLYKHIIFLSVVLSAYTANTSGSTYYVSTHGNDVSSGTSPDLPWQHCPKMPGWTGSVSLKPGDTVYFNNAHTWEVSGGNCIIQTVGGVVYDGRKWGAGKRACLRAKIDLGRSVVSFMEDHPTIPTVVRGFDIDAGGRITTGIGINHPQMEKQLTGAAKRIQDCVVHDVVSFAPATYKYGIIVSNWAGKYQVSNVEILDCTVYAISRGGINLYPGNDTAANWVRNALVRGNEVYNTGTDTSYAGSAIAVKNHVIDAVVEYNYIHDQKRGIGIGISTHEIQGFIGPENLIIRHNIICNSPHAGFYIQGLGDKSMEIYGNLIMKNKYEGLILTEDLRDKLSIKIYNNTLYQNYAEYEWSQEIRVLCKNAAITALEVKNNLLYSSAKTRALLDDYGCITSHANNLYFRPGGGALVIDKGTTYTADNIGSWEATAIKDDPSCYNTSQLPTGFTGAFGVDMKPNTDGLNLTGTSPAKDKGGALGNGLNSSINTVTRPFGSGWDIGAYEYNGVIAIDPKQHLKPKTINAFTIENTQNGVLFTCTSSIKGRGTICIYDPAGRVINRLTLRAGSAKWDGCDSKGNRCIPGSFIAQLETAEGKTAQRFIFQAY